MRRGRPVVRMDEGAAPTFDRPWGGSVAAQPIVAVSRDRAASSYSRKNTNVSSTNSGSRIAPDHSM